MLLEAHSKSIGADVRAYPLRVAALAAHYQSLRIKPEPGRLGPGIQDQMQRPDHLFELRDRLRDELEELDQIIAGPETGTAAEGRALAVLGHQVGDTRLIGGLPPSAV